MDDDLLLRYSRQIMLPEMGVEGQERLRAARVLVIGMGGLGSPVAMYLAAAGVGELVIVDDDRVDLSNLQRQIIHGTERIGQPKTASAAALLQSLNPHCRVTPIDRRLAGDELLEQARRADLVIDASDNFDTRFAVNAASVAAATPLVSGAAIRWEGQLGVFNLTGESPCYRCLYDTEGEVEQTCSENGVAAPLVGIIGSLQAMEALKLLAGVGTSLDGRLLILDALHQQSRTLKLAKDPACPVCGARP